MNLRGPPLSLFHGVNSNQLELIWTPFCSEFQTLSNFNISGHSHKDTNMPQNLGLKAFYLHIGCGAHRRIATNKTMPIQTIAVEIRLLSSLWRLLRLIGNVDCDTIISSYRPWLFRDEVQLMFCKKANWN